MNTGIHENKRESADQVLATAIHVRTFFKNSQSSPIAADAIGDTSTLSGESEIIASARTDASRVTSFRSRSMNNKSGDFDLSWKTGDERDRKS